MEDFMNKTITVVILGLMFCMPISAQQPRATLAKQNMCDAQASKVFHKGWKLEGHFKEDPSGMNGYTSHFDPSANVCYVWVRWGKIDKGGVSFADTISDAFEGRIYASYIWVNLKGKKYWEVTPTLCSVKPRGQDEITCKSEEEFVSLVDKYFGIGR
jgi:hypothetical protein